MQILQNQRTAMAKLKSEIAKVGGKNNFPKIGGGNVLKQRK